MPIKYMNDELKHINNEELDLETVRAIDRSLTETTHLILEELYKNPFMRQKDLSITIHSSASALSNHLNRIYSISPSLVESEQRGRDKFFYLTSAGEAYIRQELQKRAERTTPFPKNQSANSDNFEYDGVKIPENVFDTFWGESLRDYINLIPLFELEKKQPSDMCRVIDDIFSKLSPGLFTSSLTEKKLYTASLTDAQYYAIYFSLSQIVLNCRKKGGDKESILSGMKSALGLSDISYCLFYIAEKIDRIQATENAGALP